MSVRLPLLLVCAALSTSVANATPAAAAPDAAAARACASFSFKNDGARWRAEGIRVRNVGCRAARRLIRSYAEPRDCQFLPRCRVGRYTCRTLSADGSRFTERCTRGSRVVRWRGSYVSR